MLSVAIEFVKCAFVASSVIGTIYTIVDTYKIATTSESLLLGKIESPTDGLVSVGTYTLSLFKYGDSSKVHRCLCLDRLAKKSYYAGYP